MEVESWRSFIHRVTGPEIDAIIDRWSKRGWIGTERTTLKSQAFQTNPAI